MSTGHHPMDEWMRSRDRSRTASAWDLYEAATGDETSVPIDIPDLDDPSAPMRHTPDSGPRHAPELYPHHK